MGHAWVVTLANGRVYDPVLDQWYDADQYATTWGAVEQSRYYRTDAIRLLLTEGHYGPWQTKFCSPNERR
jgi:hypothetical protein